MARIRKKTWKEAFEKMLSGEKTFDARLANFNCQIGDILVLEEYDPELKKYTGRKIEKVTVILESVARKKNDSKFAKVKFHISIPGKNITVHRYAQDMYAAINETADRAMRYLRKAKEKRLQKMRSRPKIEWQISDPNQERPNVLART